MCYFVFHSLHLQSKETKISVIPPTPPASLSNNIIWLAEPENSDPDKNDITSHISKRENNGNDSDESSRSPSPLLRAEKFLAFARRKRKVKKKLSNKIQSSLLPSPENEVLGETDNEKQGSSSDAENGGYFL